MKKVTLGNVQERRGHRHDCAQCEVTFELDAADDAEALETVLALAREGELEATLAWTGPRHRWLRVRRVRIRLNPATIQARTVTVK